MEADRIRGLDGIRAIAILGVFYTHFVNGDSLLGDLAVRTFFILSAFLITAKLVALRDAEGFSFAALRSFYTRRALRLLPTYYAMVPGPRRDRPRHDPGWAFLSSRLPVERLVRDEHELAPMGACPYLDPVRRMAVLSHLAASCPQLRKQIGSAGRRGRYSPLRWHSGSDVMSPAITPTTWSYGLPSLDAFGVGALVFFHSGMLARPVRTRLLAAILPATLWGALQLVETDGRPRLLLVVDFLLQILPLLPMAILIAITASGTSRLSIAYLEPGPGLSPAASATDVISTTFRCFG
ncbi:acyltransferase family protein [Rhizobium beringeri]